MEVLYFNCKLTYDKIYIICNLKYILIFGGVNLYFIIKIISTKIQFRCLMAFLLKTKENLIVLNLNNK